MTTTSPNPFPADGQRKLTTVEALQRAKTLSCTLPKDTRPTCSGQVFVGIFFDGTGNNMDIDYVLPIKNTTPDKFKPSNIVKLYLAYKDKNKEGYFSYYIPGVGTPFPQIGDTNTYLFNKNRGSIAGERGEDRIIWAFTRLINAPYQFVFNNALLIDDNLAKTITSNVAGAAQPSIKRRMVLNFWQDKLKAMLTGKKPLVEQINLSVFGFSRGAAEARAFVNWLFEVCKQENGGWTFAGIPIRLQFLGIFDTVASVGAANIMDNGVLSGHQNWADNSLEIHPAVEQCVHYVAGHEARACFPLDSVRVKSTYPGNAKEVMYPGSHSDLGGGYLPSELGVSPTQDSLMSIIPGANMYHEAHKAGVPLPALELLDPALKKMLTPSNTAINDFNAYRKDANIGSGPVEEMGRRHMSLYLSQRFKYRATFYERAPYLTASPKDKSYLQKDKGYLETTQKCLIDRLSLLGGNAAAPDFDPPKMAQLRESMNKAAELSNTNDELRLITVAKNIDVKKLTPAIEHFLDNYIHDSMAGFIDMGMNEYSANGIGILKYRTVFKGVD
jgi:hypothetical protein